MFKLQNWRMATIYWVAAYIGTLLLGIGFSFITKKVCFLPFEKLMFFRLTEGDTFNISLLYPCLMFIPFWLLLSARYFNDNSERRLKKEVNWEARILASYWMALTVVADIFVWVVLPTPFRMSAIDMYGNYFPWLATMYTTVWALTYIGRLPAARSLRLV